MRKISESLLDPYLQSLYATFRSDFARDPRSALLGFLAAAFPPLPLDVGAEIVPKVELGVIYEEASPEMQQSLTALCMQFLENDFAQMTYNQLSQLVEFAIAIQIPGLQDLLQSKARSAPSSNEAEKSKKYLFVRKARRLGWKPTMEEWEQQDAAMGDYFPDKIFDGYVTLMGFDKACAEKLPAIIARCSGERLTTLRGAITKILKKQKITPGTELQKFINGEANSL